MTNEEIYIKLIQELHLEKDKRMAVYYFNNIGDIYSICSSVRYAENILKREYIILYNTDKQKEVISWFNKDGHELKSRRIDLQEIDAFHDYALKNKYSDYFVFWNLGDSEFRELTFNTYPQFAGNTEVPCFPPVDIINKYKEYFVPQKTVFIVPEAKAVSSPPIYFWNFAAEMFRYMGYEVIFNADPKKSGVYNGKCMLIPLSEIVGFANECGMIFAIRTGLLDVLSTSTAKMIIFSTKFYKPLDQIYKIENKDNRIKTIYFDDYDPYFYNFNPVKYISEHFRTSNNAIYPFLTQVKNLPEKNRLYASVKSYRFNVNFNKFVQNMPAEVFVNVSYTLFIENNRLCFSIYDVDMNRYRFDYEIYCNGRMITKMNNFRQSCFSYVLEQSGEYYVQAFITDLTLYAQECFDSVTLQYNATIPAQKDELPDCRDLYSYILALKTFETDLLVLIVSRDAHTFLKNNKDTQVLRMMKLLGLQFDFENTYRSSYIGIINSGTVVKEMHSPNQTIKYECEIDLKSIYLESSGFNAVNNDRTSVKIDINGTSYAVDKRGLNFVIWDKRNNRLLDSVAFDSFRGNIAHRKNDIDF